MTNVSYNTLSQNKYKISLWDIVVVYILHIFTISFMSVDIKYYLGLFMVAMFLLALTTIKPTTNLLYLGAFAAILNVTNSSSPIYSLIYFAVLNISIYFILRFNLLNNNPKISFFGVIAIIVIILNGRILNLIYHDVSSVMNWSWLTLLHIVTNYSLFRFFLYLLQKKSKGIING